MARFSDYAIQGELARGNMGVVFRAYDAVRGCDVALKRLHRAGSAIDAQRFGVEVAAARRLRHPHVVGIHAAGADEAGLWLVMDLVEGESLFERLQRGPLDWEQARRIGLQLADALAHAHAHGVLHRDVKPHNVLLDARGDAHLADFGLARLVGDDVRLTQEGDVLGTPIYMAPEQALAQRDRVGERTDVYGLGATLFHALTATPPFYAEQIDLLLQQVVHDAPRAPSSLVPGIPPSLDAVVLRCLAKPPAARYASAEDLGEALRLLGPAPAPRATWVAPAAAGAGLALALLAGAWWLTRPDASTRPPGANAAADARATPPAEPAPASEPPPTSDPATQRAEAAAPDPLDRLSPSEATEELQTLLNGFQTRRALPLAEALVARAPSERLPALLLAETQAELGRYDEAWAGFQRAFEREPGLRQQLSSRRYQVLQAYAEQTSWRGEPLPARWEQALGGHWRVEPGGEVVGTGGGLGTYELTALFDREAPTAPGYRLEVEVNRDPQGEGPALQAYAGVILGARSRGDFFTVFFVQNRRETDGMLAERGGAAAYRETHGVEPVVVRVTHQDGPRWRFPAEGGRLVPPQRGPWSKLALEVDGSRLQAWVDGEPVLDLQLARPLDGRVGLLKYYVHEFRYRNWTVTPR